MSDFPIGNGRHAAWRSSQIDWESPRDAGGGRPSPSRGVSAAFVSAPKARLNAGSPPPPVSLGKLDRRMALLLRSIGLQHRCGPSQADLDSRLQDSNAVGSIGRSALVEQCCRNQVHRDAKEHRKITSNSPSRFMQAPDPLSCKGDAAQLDPEGQPWIPFRQDFGRREGCAVGTWVRGIGDCHLRQTS